MHCVWLWVSLPAPHHVDQCPRMTSDSCGSNWSQTKESASSHKQRFLEFVVCATVPMCRASAAVPRSAPRTKCWAVQDACFNGILIQQLLAVRDPMTVNKKLSQTVDQKFRMNHLVSNFADEMNPSLLMNCHADFARYVLPHHDTTARGRRTSTSQQRIPRNW